MSKARGISIRRVWALSAITLLVATLAVATILLTQTAHLLAKIDADDNGLEALNSSIENRMRVMLSQEVGLRGFLATGAPPFLEPYELGRREEQRIRAALDLARLPAEDRDEVQQALQLEERAARRWHDEIAEPQIAAGRHSLIVDVPSMLIDGKPVFDAYRAAHGTLKQAAVRARINAARRRRAWLSHASRVAAAMLALFVLVGVLVSRAIVRRTLHPLVALSEAAERGEVSAGVVRASGLREILVLAETLETLFRSVNDRAMRDGLTRAYNRGYLAEWMPRQLRLVRRSGAPLSALMVDLDHFKKINDTHGHAAGDQVLVALARCIESQLRASDVVVRYGGEEFTVLLPDTPIAGGFVTAERLRAAIAAMTEREGLPAGLRITASIGVAAISNGEDGAQLIPRADAALYQAKRGGRNRVVTAPPARSAPALAVVGDARLAS